MKKQIRISVKGGSARIDEGCPAETIAALQKLAEAAYEKCGELNKSHLKLRNDILGLDKMIVVCSDCNKKQKGEIILVENDLGFKTCKHITHSVCADGLNVWQ